ncbi:MAG: hypothetical protein OXB90_11625, partial [Acidimicrobiaceae bacterium]|nr:hypothetical protein [Acidimicrobiaceae bacterium]
AYEHEVRFVVAARNTGAADEQTDLNGVQIPAERPTDPARTLHQPRSHVDAQARHSLRLAH